ncbi:M20/M25/M40 family metallo-hydrolase [Botryobacter ruber]|uniref:M20/M25/M40 family metallo-hydrolase n=1 Tax=Botryobacter ruber TaxID=2171629 RepID=UPI000E0BF2EE|nr:M20/M25/M40 family metallo-hydrolase [Botryobacter ruber]
MFTRLFVTFAFFLGQLWSGSSAANAQFAVTSDTVAAGGDTKTGAIRKLAEAVKLRTVSRLDTGAVNFAAFTALHHYLQQAFPLVHRQLAREVVNDYSLLYTWRGSDPALKPVLFSAHLDVVPVEDASDEKWKYDPFAGMVADGYIWGRGTMDDKYRVIALLEAVEQMLQRGYTPARTILLAFGHDEEVGGLAGAGKISALLGERSVRLAAVFDEGLAVTDGLMPSIDRPVAFIGTAAKGNINFQLTVKGGGGHSSIPPSDTPISVLGEAIARINRHPFKARITPSTRNTLDILSQEMGTMYRISMKFYWLLKGIIKKKLSNNQATDALIRTKVAPTIIQAGDKFNVLPRVATAVINVRILTGETDASVLAYLKKVVDDDRVQIEQYGVYTPPSPVTSTDTWLYSALKSTILEVFPDAAVAPALFPGATDAKHYTDKADNVFLFAPQVVNPENARLVHNVNERLSVEVFEGCIVFYQRLLERVSGKGSDSAAY